MHGFFEGGYAAPASWDRATLNEESGKEIKEEGFGSLAEFVGRATVKLVVRRWGAFLRQTFLHSLHIFLDTARGGSYSGMLNLFYLLHFYFYLYDDQ